MRGSKYLVLKGRTWWFHRAIPLRLQPAFSGLKTVTKSLMTSDLHIAQGRRDLAFAETERDFLAATIESPTGRDRVTVLGLAWVGETKLWRDDPVAWAGRVLGQDHLDDDDVATPWDFLEEQADAIGREHGPGEQGRFLELARGALPLDHHLEAHLSECGISSRAVVERRTAVKRLMGWDRDLTLVSLTRAKAGQYLSEALAGVHPKTANKAISNVRRYWDWLKARGHVKDNPWTDQHIDGRKARQETVAERAFTDLEIGRLFHSQWPDNMRGADRSRLEDAMRIAALSGMRIEEICQLTVADCADGTFNVRRSKTKAGVRRVPIHPALEAIVARRGVGKDVRRFLLDELGRGGAKERSAPLSKQFARYRKALAVDDRQEGQRRSLVNFHSFRRWFVTCAERAGQAPHIIEAVVGHKRPGMTLGVYSGGPSVEKQMRSCIEAVRMPLAEGG